MGWACLGWAGLALAGLADGAGLAWAGLGSLGLGWLGLGVNGLGWAGLAGVQEKAGSQKNQKVSFLIFNFDKKLHARLQGDSFLIFGSYFLLSSIFSDKA